MREPTRNTEGLETHLASGGCAGNLPAFCQSIVKIIPFPVFSLCQISIFREEKRKKKTKNSFGKFAASIQPDSSMPLAIASLQQEVLKPALHFRQGCSEAEEGEADQRHFVPQSDPKTKCYRGQSLGFSNDFLSQKHRTDALKAKSVHLPQMQC